jgi:hypothetical protein
MDTWAFIYSPEMRSCLSSREASKMKTDADGGVKLYVGPEAPEELEGNWIPTASKTPYFMLRFYGPEDAFYDKSFKLPDVTLIESGGALPQ